ncbi:hypothetical protein ACQCVK_13465 [Rossellomorea vietnamensis]|uniref:hypothetical protein n=1 Tax=Rossellomorea vietnamensis TaxID=218284 RepID=UPI003CE9335E
MRTIFDFENEDLLVNTFIKSLRIKKNLILNEVDCWQGRADVAEVISENIQLLSSEISQEQVSLLRNLTCAKIISLLHYNSNRTTRFIYNKIGIQTKTIDAWLSKLIKAEIIVNVEVGKFRIHPEFLLPNVKFIAYEVKLYNWKRALYQAIQYKGFANKSYVVMPHKNIKPAINNLQAFVANNIGLIEVYNDGSFKTILQSRNCRPTSKAFNIIGMGIAFDRIKKGSYNEESLLNSEIASFQTSK